MASMTRSRDTQDRFVVPDYMIKVVDDFVHLDEVPSLTSAY